MYVAPQDWVAVRHRLAGGAENITMFVQRQELLGDGLSRVLLDPSRCSVAFEPQMIPRTSF